MKRMLRKTTFHLGNVTYKSGGFTNNLSARELSVEVVGDSIWLSLDLSPNEARGAEQSNSFADAQELKGKFASVDFFQLHRNTWLEKGLEQTLRSTEVRGFVVELRFKDGTVREVPARLEVDDHDLWFHATEA